MEHELSQDSAAETKPISSEEPTSAMSKQPDHRGDGEIETKGKTGIDNRSFHVSVYVVSLVTLLIGMMLGILLVKEFPVSKVTDLPSVNKDVNIQSIKLPPDAVVIESCSTHQGTLYVRPSDIPIGPVYMVHNGKIIGLEFMLDREQFLAGEKFDFLPVLGMKIDHANVGFLEYGHAGHTSPHYHVDLYSVSRDIEQNIMCGNPQNSDMMMDMSNMNASASPTILTPITSTVPGPSTRSGSILPMSTQTH